MEVATGVTEFTVGQVQSESGIAAVLESRDYELVNQDTSLRFFVRPPSDLVYAN